ncbi:hypothetical protein [Streptomyces sparsus]
MTIFTGNGAVGLLFAKGRHLIRTEHAYGSRADTTGAPHGSVTELGLLSRIEAALPSQHLQDAKKDSRQASDSEERYSA